MVSEPPKIAFPCDYPIKVILVSGEMHVSEVLAVVQQHAPEVDELNADVKPSRNGNYGSVRLSIRATGEAQLTALHQALMNLPYVKMVL